MTDETIEEMLARHHEMRVLLESATRLERDVLNAVTSGNRLNLAPDVFSIASAIMDMPGTDRGMAVTDVTIDQVTGGFAVVVSLKTGDYRALDVASKCPP